MAKKKLLQCKYCKGTEFFTNDKGITRWGVRCQLTDGYPIRNFDNEAQAQLSIDEWCTGDGRRGCRPYLLKETGHSYNFSGDLLREFDAMEEHTVAKIEVPKPDENTCPYYKGIDTTYSPKGYCIDCMVRHDRTPYDLKSWALDAVKKLCLNEDTYSKCRFFDIAQKEERITPADIPASAPELPTPQEASPMVTTEQRSITDVTAEIRFYKAQTVSNIIEIGKRLLEAKAMLGHGQWGEWLHNEVEFSQDTACNFMRIAEEYSNSEPVRNLNYTKLLALLSIPTDERDDFIEATHVVDGEEKTVDEMSKRELQKVIKECDEVKQQLAAAQRTAEEQRQKALLQEGLAAQSQNELGVQTEKLRKLKDENRRQRLDIERLESKPIDVAVQQPSDAQMNVMRENIRHEVMQSLALPDTYFAKKGTEEAGAMFMDAIGGAAANGIIALMRMDSKAAAKTLRVYISTLERYTSELSDRLKVMMQVDRSAKEGTDDVDW